MSGTLVTLERKVFEEAKVRIFVMTMQNGENRFNPSFLREFHDRLDDVEREITSAASEESGWGAALITTGGGGRPAGRFYSNGLDLQWVAQRRQAADHEALRQLARLFATAVSRILAFPIPTFAVLNGHCYAGALMLAFAHDYRLMREDRGWLCLPALDLGISLPQPFYEMLKMKLSSPLVLRKVVFECRRFTGAEASTLGLVDWTGSEADLMPTALEWAAERASRGAGKHIKVYGELKQAIYGPVVKLLEMSSSISYPEHIDPSASRDTTLARL